MTQEERDAIHAAAVTRARFAKASRMATSMLHLLDIPVPDSAEVDDFSDELWKDLELFVGVPPTSAATRQLVLCIVRDRQAQRGIGN